MPPEILEGIMPILAVLSMGGIVLMGMKIRYQHKANMLQAPKNDEELERLADAMDSMYEQTRALREEIGELQERLDFHERLLARPTKQNGDGD